MKIDQCSLRTKSLFVDEDGQPTSENAPGAAMLFSAFNLSFVSQSGSAGVTFAQNSRTTFKANIAGGFCAPNIAELSANAVYKGTLRYEYGNTAIRAKTVFRAILAANGGPGTYW